jgi:predicted membrane channel-forming protein YqfA (hemolysin III family)
MKKEIKAALLSAFVFPGSGQMYLGRYLRGLSMMIFVLAGLGIMIGMATMNALEVLENIQRTGGIADMNAIANLAAASSTQHRTSYDPLLWILMACCWVFSIIDAYRTGKRADGADAGGDKVQR